MYSKNLFYIIHKIKNMYFNIFIIIIILSYNCLMTCSFRTDVQKSSQFESNKTGINDCSLQLPDKNDFKKPTPSQIYSKAHFDNFSAHNGYLNVKHNSFLKLSCSKNKFMSVADQNAREIIVKCLKGNTLQFGQQMYTYDYFECGDLFDDDSTTELYYLQSNESSSSEIKTTSTTQTSNSYSTTKVYYHPSNESSSSEIKTTSTTQTSNSYSTTKVYYHPSNESSSSEIKTTSTTQTPNSYSSTQKYLKSNKLSSKVKTTSTTQTPNSYSSTQKYLKRNKLSSTVKTASTTRKYRKRNKRPSKVKTASNSTTQTSNLYSSTQKYRKRNKLPSKVKSATTKQTSGSDSSTPKYLKVDESPVKTSSSDCFIKVFPADSHLPVPYYNVARASILRPDIDGVLRFKTNTSIQLSCTTKEFKWSKLQGLKEVTVVCAQNTQVLYDGEEYEYYDFRCEEIPPARLIMTSHKCQNNKSIAAVGFQAKYKFLILYNICFDEVNKIPLYSWYFVNTPHYSTRTQSSNRTRPSFIKSKQFFGEVDTHTLYKTQTVMMLKTLRDKKLVSKYIDLKNERFLARGHLVARTEFAYGFEQEATFFYENTTPTWQMFNKNIWKHVEKYFSRKMSKITRVNTHLVIAGTYGQCSLPDIDNVQKPLFLSFPRVIPVPLFIWKMNINTIDRSNGIVFIGLNNPYIKLNSSMYMCKPIRCPQTDIDIKDLVFKQLIYCCTKRSFEYGYGSRINPIIYHRNLK